MKPLSDTMPYHFDLRELQTTMKKKESYDKSNARNSTFPFHVAQRFLSIVAFINKDIFTETTRRNASSHPNNINFIIFLQQLSLHYKQVSLY